MFSFIIFHSNADLVDSSGVRIHYTDRLRENDIGILEVGLEYTDKMAIPPGQEAFDLTGYCISECTRAVRRNVHVQLLMIIFVLIETI